MLDHNVQQIVDLGFSVAQAEYALKQNRNNVDRALRSLQVRFVVIINLTVTYKNYTLEERGHWSF